MTYDETPDRALVRRFRSGDGTAFDDLYARYRRRLLHASRAAGADAEDVVQETFVRLWQALPRLPDDLRVYPYAYVVARRLAAAHARDWTSLDDVPHAVAAPHHEGADDVLRDALAALPERQREAVGYRLLESLPRSAAARELGVAPRDLDALVERALFALREQVRPPGP